MSYDDICYRCKKNLNGFPGNLDPQWAYVGANPMCVPCMIDRIEELEVLVKMLSEGGVNTTSNAASAKVEPGLLHKDPNIVLNFKSNGTEVTLNGKPSSVEEFSDAFMNLFGAFLSEADKRTR